MKSFAQCISEFSSYVNISSSSTPTLYTYVEKIYNECISQYGGSSNNGLPSLYSQSLFPNVYNYFGSNGTSDAAKESLVGWCIALVLTEIRPKKRNSILKIGYELGGYTKSSQLYGYSFKNDPMIARLVAGAIYASMRSKLSPNINTMKSEIGSSSDNWNWGFQSGYDTSSSAVGESDFYIDFRNFMPTAPGPNHSSSILDSKDSYNNIQVDRDIHENIIVPNYNLDSGSHQQETAQAISDKDMEVEHYFGSSTTVLGYTIRPIFSNYLKPNKIDRTEGFGKFMHWTTRTGMAARKILQGTSEYKRFRPGCSWSQTGAKNSTSDDRRNALANFEIEDNDGSKEWDAAVVQYYYDENGNWNVSGISSAADYKNAQQTSLHDNSYPSGHSSGIWCVGQTLMELYPNQADTIMQDCNRFAIERTICRYHWTSDTIIGRVLGSAINAVLHATSDYDTIKGGNYSSLKNLTLPNGSSSGGNSGGQSGDGLDYTAPDAYDPLYSSETSDLGNHFRGKFNNESGGADSEGTTMQTAIGCIYNIPEEYGLPKLKEITIPDGSSMLYYNDISVFECDNLNDFFSDISIDSSKKQYLITTTKILKNGASNFRRVRVYFDFENSSNFNHINVYQKSGDGSGNNSGGSGGSGGGSNVNPSGGSTGSSDDSGTQGSDNIGGIGNNRLLKYKKDIIHEVASRISTINDLQINGLSYNGLTLYSYFHNDICIDLQDLWTHYYDLRVEYDKLKLFYDSYKEWADNNLQDLNTILSELPTIYEAINQANIDVPNFDYSETVIDSITVDDDGDPVVSSHEETHYPFSGWSMDNFTVSELNDPIPDPNDIDPPVVNLAEQGKLYDEYTYTWHKGSSTYGMPYEDVQMPDIISYVPTIQNYWQAQIYTYMKWSNNQFDSHYPLTP